MSTYTPERQYPLPRVGDILPHGMTVLSVSTSYGLDRVTLINVPAVLSVNRLAEVCGATWRVAMIKAEFHTQLPGDPVEATVSLWKD